MTNNPVAMIADLEKHFVGVVAHVLDMVAARPEGGDHFWEAQYAVKFIERLGGERVMIAGQELPIASLMFHLEVELAGQAFMDDIVLIANALDVFCADESEPVTLHGLAFRLGDGDDSSAVFFEEGKFKIWLRGF